MKTLKITTTITATLFMLFLVTSSLFAQLEFIGNYEDGMGGAGWDADGSGPEPYGNGHGGVFYYAASRDYVDASATCGAQMTNIINGFPAFEQTLSDNGYSVDQVTVKFALANLGDDQEGIDYFSLGNMHYCNFYPIVITMELDGEALVEATGNYLMYKSGPGVREFESGYLKINNISGSSTEPVQNVANAFVGDMASEELTVVMQISDNVANVTGNGRTGAYTDVFCTFEKGLPEMPLQGLFSDDEGAAAWDADGTGPEPYGNGHGNMVYYVASVDYDGINPDPEACLGHFIEGSQGFLNTLLQLQYRGFEIGDLKVKMGLCSLGPDVEGEDWGNENGLEWLNEYNNTFVIEIGGEPILEFLQDTNKMTFINPATGTWAIESSVGKVYDISDSASANARFVAQSFLKDMGSHSLKIEVSNISYVGAMPGGNGRTGVWYELVAGAFVGVHEKATFIPEGTVSGTWTVDNSPYYIEGPVTVENNQTLIIEPGVRVAPRGAFPITVQGCVISEGTASDKIMFTASNPNITWDGFDFDATPVSNETSVFDHCVFQYGRAQGDGALNNGGTFAIRDYDNIEIYNSTFRHNIADIEDNTYYTCGGAIALWNASPFIQKCIFYDNYALDYAGAILVYAGSSPVISNCLFYENESKKGGSLAFYQNGNGILIDNTIANNYSNYGGGLYFYNQSYPEIINSIIWGNSAINSGNQVYFSTTASAPGFFYNDIEGGEDGFGGGNYFQGEYLDNIDEDPIFGQNEDFPYKISEESPCVNIGVPDTSSYYYQQYQPEYCLCGFTRDYGGRIDMGAYETDVVSNINNKLIDNNDIFIYPNPVTSILNVSGSLIENSNVSFEIFNFIGQKIYDYVPATQVSEFKIDISDYTAGTYILKLTSGDKIYSEIFIKQ